MVKTAFIMSKNLRAGLNKKRLIKNIGNIKIKKMILNNFENCEKIFMKQKNWKLKYYLSEKQTFRSFTFTFSKNIYPQKGKNLGEKMWYLKKIVKGSFLLFGSDIPAISSSSIERAFKSLKNSELVIGPTTDGGFWLIGFANKKKIIYPFDNIRWSSKYTLNDFIHNLNKYKISFQFTDKLRDIDILEDYCNYEKGF